MWKLRGWRGGGGGEGLRLTLTSGQRGICRRLLKYPFYGKSYLRPCIGTAFPRDGLKYFITIFHLSLLSRAETKR